MKLTRARTVASAAMLSALLMFSIAYYWPIQEAYHPLNFDWSGCSRIANTTQNATLLLSYDSPLPNTTSLLAIIGPSTDISRDEGSKIGNFLQDGGIVLLADDFGTGNGLLKALNVSAQFSKKPLADLYYYSRDPRFPFISDFSPSPATANLTTVVLNRPSYVEMGNSSLVTTIGWSSPFSFIDYRGEGKLLSNETIGSYPVMASVNIGKGTLFLLADPSMFINDMIGLYDNMQVFRNLLKMGDGSVVFDVAHLGNAPLTNWRITLKNGLNSLRLGKESMYIPLLVVTVLVLSFSIQLLRLAKSQKVAK